MSSSRRLLPLVSHAESQEALRHQQLLEASARLREAEVQLAQLQEYRRGYSGGPQSDAGATLGSVSWRDRHVFLSRLDEAVSQQQARVVEHQRLVEVQRKAWIESRVRTQALQKVVDKRVQRERVDANRREQRALDENNAGMAARRAPGDRRPR